MTNVAHNGVVLHLLHGLKSQDALVTGGGDKDINEVDNSLQAHNAETLHGGLQGADRVNLGDVHDGTSGTHGEGATFADITETKDADSLTGHHNVSGTAQTIGQRVLATVQVVELGLGDRVVDVDGREQKLVLLGHDVESVDTGGGLLRHTDQALSHAAESVGVTGNLTLQDGQDQSELVVVGAARVRQGAVLLVRLLGLDTLVDEKGHISSVINDHIGTLTLLVHGPDDGVQGALPVLLKGLTLPGEDVARAITGHGSSSVVLGREDVARAPSEDGTQRLKSLDQHGSLNGHVQRTGDSAAVEHVTVLLAACHQTGHLVLSEVNLLATEVGKGNISDLPVSSSHFYFFSWQ